MAALECPHPFWVVDDFTACFQQNYLDTLFPLAFVASSVSILILTLLRRLIRQRWAHRSGQSSAKGLPIDNSTVGRTDLPPDNVGPSLGNDDDDDKDVLTIRRGARIALAKSAHSGTVVEISVPPYHTLTVLIEITAAAGLMAVCAVPLIVQTGEQKDATQVSITGLFTWLYVLILILLRFVLGDSRLRAPRLWNHTAWMYLTLWWTFLPVFRSALLYPSSGLSQALVIARFLLTSVLLTVVTFTRVGNKNVKRDWENGLEPDELEIASLFAIITFTWIEPLMWKSWKTNVDMSQIWNVPLTEKAAFVHARYRKMKKTSRLWFHLLKFLWRELLFQYILSLTAVFNLLPVLFLQRFLEFIESPSDQPLNLAWLYLILMVVTNGIFILAMNGWLFAARRTTIKIRAVLRTEIYTKVLRRKAGASTATSLLKDTKPDQDGAGAPAKDGLLSYLKRLLNFGKTQPDADSTPDHEAAQASTNATDFAKAPGEGDLAHSGTIINLMSNDCDKVAEASAYLMDLLGQCPVQIVMAIVLLWKLLGTAVLPGLLTLIIFIPLTAWSNTLFMKYRTKVQSATDLRVQITNEVFQNIRIIKYFAWETLFGLQIEEKRKAQLQAQKAVFTQWALSNAVSTAIPVAVSLGTFWAYTIWANKPLYPSVAFPAMQLFLLLRHPLNSIPNIAAHVQEALVSLYRIDRFLNEEETEKYSQVGPDNVDEVDGQPAIGFQNSSLTWGGKSAALDDDTSAFRLMQINVRFHIGGLNLIIGPTGSGKTSMILGLLGEMTHIGGRVFCPGGRSREDIRPDPQTGFTNTIAYAAQTAWLINGSIKNNITFMSPFDEGRYQDVVVACALARDLEILDNGDETIVGDKGISLSGGQKQRVALARALYSDSAHIILDDCLSAVDSHTAHWIFTYCIRGPLMKNRTCIMVTHNLALCVADADFVVALDNGRVVGQGTPEEMIATGLLGEDVQKSRSGSTAISRIPSRIPSGDESTDMAVGMDDGAGTKTKRKLVVVDAMDEAVATGAVKWPVLKLYLTSMGSWSFWLITVLLFSLADLCYRLTSFWIREFSNQYVVKDQQQQDPAAMATVGDGEAGQLHHFHMTPSRQLFFTGIGLGGNPSCGMIPPSPVPMPVFWAFDEWALHEVDTIYYMGVLLAIGIVSIITAFLHERWTYHGSLQASKQLHRRLLETTCRAKFSFFDKTPLGQIMNRFSKDMEVIDDEIATIASLLYVCMLASAVEIAIITGITPAILPATVVITLVFFLVSMLYMRSGRDLKRLESINRSPIFQLFGETLGGATTIRAYGVERYFIRQAMDKMNMHARPYMSVWASNRWLNIRADLISDLVTFLAGAMIIINRDRIDVGLGAVALVNASSFAGSIQWLVRLGAMLEQNMNSMERVKEYLDIETEAPAEVEDHDPPAGWPKRGSVEFIDYSTRYRPELEPVLRKISFKIEAGEKVGVVGRTGAGKSSLTLALFRALEADSGRILIDGLDISPIGLQVLRDSITIVPQDPTLFSGTIRSNLDPFARYTDEEVFSALRQVQLIDRVKTKTSDGVSVPPTPFSATFEGALALREGSGGTVTQSEMDSVLAAMTANKNVFRDLSSSVAESGTNLSQGQRQLLCLARAMLRKPRVLVMDEATASIDYETDVMIQQAIRKFTSTTITIAHRLRSIIYYDKVLVLEQGDVVDYGPPYELMQRPSGVFRDMCLASGEFDELLVAAREASARTDLIELSGGAS